MAQRPPRQKPAPAEILSNLSLGYNGYTDPTQTNPQMWAAAQNVFSGAFGYLQRLRIATIVANLTQPVQSMKFYALPGIGAYLLADTADGKLWAYDAGDNGAGPYAKFGRNNPYIDPFGVGNALLAPPWSREVIQNIVYEMNGQVKQSGRHPHAGLIENFGLDTPDASPQVVITSGSSQTISAISRSNGVVSVTLGSALTVPGGNGVGMVNVSGVTDTSYNGTFVVVSGSGTTSLTWTQFGQNNSSSGGTVDVNITKAIGRSYAFAWENANKPHVGAPSPSTQYILYTAQNGTINCVEPGTVVVSSVSAIVTGTGTFFTQAWVGRSLFVDTVGSIGRIASVQSTTQLTLVAAAGVNASGALFQVYDPQSTHIRLYETADGGATYFRVLRNSFSFFATSIATSGLQFFDTSNAEPPNFPFTTETSQLFNLPPPIGAFIRQYQGIPLIFGVPGALQSFFYGNQQVTTIGQMQESFAPLNQVTLPIQNGQLNGYIEFPGSAVLFSDKQDMFRLNGLLTDNTATASTSTSTPTQQGATITRLPYNLGCAHPDACALTPLGGIWLTSNGEIWLFTNTYAPRNIGRPVQDVLQSISPNNLKLARAKYYHSNNRNWYVLSVPANGASANNTNLILDLDLLASNGSPSYFTFDMATNHPSWFISTMPSNALEVVYEANTGLVRLMGGNAIGFSDLDYQSGFGSEIPVPGASVKLHAWGNDTAFLIKQPSFFRFTTNRDPSMLALDGWSFNAYGIDDDYYTFTDPLELDMTPGVNDTTSLSFGPLTSGSPFRHSPELFRVGGVNFIKGRRIQLQVNFPSDTGTIYQLRAIQIGFSATPPN